MMRRFNPVESAHLVRTTIRLDESLLKSAKRRALETGKTLTAVIEEALRESLARKGPGKKLERFKIKPFKGTGLQPGVNLDDSASLLDIMEGRDVSP